MKVNIKKIHPDAIIPSYATAGDAGMDLTAVSKEYSGDGFYIEYGTGLAIEIPTGYVGLLFARSSISKTSMVLANHVGVIDSGYRGEIKFRFKDFTKSKLSGREVPFGTVYNVGDRIGQLMILPYPQIELVEVSDLTDSDRAAGGFGSTGK
jgi:dUTP pyrophosphatase